VPFAPGKLFAVLRHLCLLFDAEGGPFTAVDVYNTMRHRLVADTATADAAASNTTIRKVLQAIEKANGVSKLTGLCGWLADQESAVNAITLPPYPSGSTDASPRINWVFAALCGFLCPDAS
jgi:hypothetical protein